MFGTMGMSELIIILAILLIIFGAGRLPQIGEGIGKALKGFRKEVSEMPPPGSGQVETAPAPAGPAQTAATASAQPATSGGAQDNTKPNVPYVPGPELTPGTTASLLYQMGPQAPQTPRVETARDPSSTVAPTPHVVSMEERAVTPPPTARAQYPPVPAGGPVKPATRRPSAIVNKEAVARVQAQQAALKARTAPPVAAANPRDMQTLGEGVGGMVRSFRQAVADVRSTIDPEMRTIQSEIDAAEKDIQQSLEAVAETPAVQEDFPKPA
jgi:TatA/E family protein of Tat protein translocase